MFARKIYQLPNQWLSFQRQAHGEEFCTLWTSYIDLEIFSILYVDNFPSCLFGCSHTRTSRIITEEWMFNCNRTFSMCTSRISPCFRKRTIPFIWMSIEVKVAPMTVYPFSLLIITRWMALTIQIHMRSSIHWERNHLIAWSIPFKKCHMTKIRNHAWLMHRHN